MSNTYFRYSLMPKEFYKILRDEKTRKKRFLQVCKSILQTNYPNLSDIQVAWASKDMASKNTLGFFDISKNTMFINPTYLKIYNEMAIKENPCFVYHIFDTIVHEGRHAEQAYNAKIFKQNIKKFEKLDYKSQYIALIMRLHENEANLIKKIVLNGEVQSDRFYEILKYKTTNSTTHGSTYFNQLVERDARMHTLEVFRDLLQTSSLQLYIFDQLDIEKKENIGLPSQYSLDKDIEDSKYLIDLMESNSHNKKNYKKEISELEETIAAIEVLLIQKFGPFYNDAIKERELLNKSNEWMEIYTSRFNALPQSQKDFLDKKLLEIEEDKQSKEYEEFRNQEGNKEFLADGTKDDFLYREYELDQKFTQQRQQNQYKNQMSSVVEYLTKITFLPEIIQLGLLKPEEIIQINSLIKDLKSWEENDHSNSRERRDFLYHKAEDLSCELFSKQEELYNNIFGLNASSFEKDYRQTLDWKEKVTGVSLMPDQHDIRFYKRDTEEFEKAFEKASNAVQEPSLV